MYIVGHELRRIAEQILNAAELHEDCINGDGITGMSGQEDDQYI